MPSTPKYKAFFIAISLLSAVFPFFILKETSHSGSNALLFLSSLASLAIAFWWWQELKSAAISECRKLSGWRNGLFLFFLVAGLYGMAFTAYRKIHQTGTNPFDVSIWATLFAFVVAVVTAYYLVVLQGTSSQSRELLAKLENKENEIKTLQDEMRLSNQERAREFAEQQAKMSLLNQENVNEFRRRQEEAFSSSKARAEEINKLREKILSFNQETETFRSIGAFAYSLAEVVKQTEISGVLRDVLSHNTEILDLVLNLHDNIFVDRQTESRHVVGEKISRISANIIEISEKMKASEYESCYAYIPLGLLRQVIEHLESSLEDATLSDELRNKANESLEILGTLKPEVARRMRAI